MISCADRFNNGSWVSHSSWLLGLGSTTQWRRLSRSHGPGKAHAMASRRWIIRGSSRDSWGFMRFDAIWCHFAGSFTDMSKSLNVRKPTAVSERGFPNVSKDHSPAYFFAILPSKNSLIQSSHSCFQLPSHHDDALVNRRKHCALVAGGEVNRVCSPRMFHDVFLVALLERRCVVCVYKYI